MLLKDHLSESDVEILLNYLFEVATGAQILKTSSFFRNEETWFNPQ